MGHAQLRSFFEQLVPCHWWAHTLGAGLKYKKTQSKPQKKLPSAPSQWVLVRKHPSFQDEKQPWYIGMACSPMVCPGFLGPVLGVPRLSPSKTWLPFSATLSPQDPCTLTCCQGWHLSVGAFIQGWEGEGSRVRILVSDSWGS